MARANVFDPDFDADEERNGFVRRRARVGLQAGASRLGATLHELRPGETAHPYHWHLGNEEMTIVLAGRPSLRTPAGSRELEEGEVVSHLRGEEGAHQVTNRTDALVRFLVLSEMNGPDVIGYPDSSKIAARGDPPGRGASGVWLAFREEDAVDYWEGEQAPDG